VRLRDRGPDRAGVDLDHLRVLCLLVAREHLPSGARPAPDGPALQVLRRLLVEADDAALAAGLDRHVAHREPPVHGQVFDRLAGELHRLVEGAVDADHADRVQHQVLADDVAAGTTVIHELDRLGHAQPDAAPGHGGGEVGGADAGAEGGDGAVGAGVRVGADDEVAGGDQAHVGEDHVLDPGSAGLEEVRDAVLARELAHLLHLTGRLDVLVGREVVGHEDDARRVGHLVEPGVLELGDGQRRGDVVGQRQVDPRLDDLAGPHRLEPRRAGDDLLGDRLTHQRPLTVVAARASGRSRSRAAAALLSALT